MKDRVSPGFPSVTSSVTHPVTDPRKKLELLGTDALNSLDFLELDVMYKYTECCSDDTLPWLITATMTAN